jgi:hypothetical protein
MLLLLAFYASSPLDTGAASYVIDSVFGFLVLVWLAGGSPAASHFLLLRQKKSNQRKGDPTVCVPSLRYGQPAVLGPAGVSCKLAALRQARSLIRLALRSSAHTEGLGERGRERNRGQIQIRGLAPSPFGGRLGWGPAAGKLQQVNSSSHLKTACCIESPNPAPIQRAPIPTFPQWGKELTGFLRSRIRSQPVLAGPVMRKKNGIRAARSLSEASLRGPPFFLRSAGCPKRSAGTQTAGRLFFAYFLLAKQKKVSRRRATPGQQPPAAQQNPRTTMEGKQR